LFKVIFGTSVYRVGQKLDCLLKFVTAVYDDVKGLFIYQFLFWSNTGILNVKSIPFGLAWTHSIKLCYVKVWRAQQRWQFYQPWGQVLAVMPISATFCCNWIMLKTIEVYFWWQHVACFTGYKLHLLT